MNVTLPPRKDGTQPDTLELAPGRPLVIIGANGAGKTRFTRALVASLKAPALHLNALNGLYAREAAPGPISTDKASLRSRFDSAVLATSTKSDSRATTLELLLSQLMHDELLNLIGYKLALADGRKASLKATRLDRVVEIWQEVFPGNRVLVDSGKLLFSRSFDHQDDAYSVVRLSDGERAVLYYTGAVLYAPAAAVIFVDAPELFLHPTLTSSLWNRLEALRSDCIFCYTTHDPAFASSRNGSQFVWVRDCDTASDTWDYRTISAREGITDEIYLTLTGSRKPVLFIEGEVHSIDARLYPLIFPDFTVRSLGSCNKVIEATRTFNDLSVFHNMDSRGIVDRDRRNEDEVAYLRRKRIMVPEVAEIENMFILEPIVGTMARRAGKNADRVVSKVRNAVINLFSANLKDQALMHTRHRMKRTVEYRVDARFSSITKLEEHLAGLVDEIAPRRVYEKFCSEFQRMVSEGDYRGILRVFNLKSMLISCNVAPMCGFKTKDDYIEGVFAVLRLKNSYADEIRAAVRDCLKVDI